MTRPVLGILGRYLIRQLLVSWLAVGGLLFVLMSMGQVPQILTRALNREVAPELIGKVIWWMTLANAPAILPLSLLLAIVATLGRLGSELELTAMRAGGYSTLRLLGPVLLLVIPVAVLQAAAAIDWAPESFCNAVAVRAQAARNLALAPVRAGVFQSFGGGSTYYVQGSGPDGTLENIFIKRADSNTVNVLTAKRGRIDPVLADDSLRIRLFDGRQYVGIPGQADFRTLDFAEYTSEIPLPRTAQQCERSDTRTTVALRASTKPKDRAELYWRLGLPIMVIVIGLLALPISNVRPRQGRYARIPIALGLFFLYLNAGISLQSWMERHAASGVAMFWALHGALLLVAVWAVARSQWGPRLFNFARR